MTLLKTKEVLSEFKISRTTLWKLVKENKVDQVTLDNRSRNLYSREQIASLLNLKSLEVNNGVRA